MTASAQAIDKNDPQADAVAFLEAAGTLSPSERAQRIDTHAARIFLAGDRAWKLKRAVSLGYLDFSSTERRRIALEAELYLNRRTAPDLYLALHPLCRDAGGALSIGGEGQVIDWLLEMRRFPDDALLEHVAERGQLGDRLLTGIADKIAALHRGTPPCLDTAGHARIVSVIAGNRTSMERYPAILPSSAVAHLIDRQVEIATRYAGLLEARAARGRIRHGHGDLHLANIAVIDGEAVLFDCLEFDPALATTDVLYDLAFLLMDLWGRGLKGEANRLYNRYLDVSPEDEEGCALLPLFLSVRAAIRAHALAARGDDAKIADQARAYLALAKEVLEPASTRLIAIGGLSGTGKSTIARLVGGDVGRAPGARIVRSDVIRKRLAGLAPETPLPPDAYSAQASLEVYAEVERLAGEALDAGQSVIADAVYAERGERLAIAQVAATRNDVFEGIWLEAPPSTLKCRIDARRNDASDADARVAALQQHYDVGELAGWHRVDAQGDPERVAASVRTLVGC